MSGIDQYTSLMLHCDGVNASTTFLDSSTNHITVTAVGNAKIDTAQFKFGNASGLFDGTGDSLTLDGSSNFAFGTGDFTIDFWLRFNSIPAANIGFYDGRSGGDNATEGVLYHAGSVSNFLLYFVNGVNRITGTTALSTATWYHIALARSGTSTKLFLNGTQEGATYTDNTNYTNPASRPIIGDFDGSGASLNGWLDEYRISKGIARWTANFTSPTVPYSWEYPLFEVDQENRAKIYRTKKMVRY